MPLSSCELTNSSAYWRWMATVVSLLSWQKTHETPGKSRPCPYRTDRLQRRQYVNWVTKTHIARGPSIAPKSQTRGWPA